MSPLTTSGCLSSPLEITPLVIENTRVSTPTPGTSGTGVSKIKDRIKHEQTVFQVFSHDIRFSSIVCLLFHLWVLSTTKTVSLIMTKLSYVVFWRWRKRNNIPSLWLIKYLVIIRDTSFYVCSKIYILKFTVLNDRSNFSFSSPFLFLHFIQQTRNGYWDIISIIISIVLHYKYTPIVYYRQLENNIFNMFWL